MIIKKKQTVSHSEVEEETEKTVHCQRSLPSIQEKTKRIRETFSNKNITFLVLECEQDVSRSLNELYRNTNVSFFEKIITSFFLG